MTKHTLLIELRWTTLATLALCTFLPGCPMTDNYFIDLASAGSGSMVTNGGASQVLGGAPSVAGSPDQSGSNAGGPEAHPDHMGNDPVGGGTDAGTGTPDAGSSDAGSSEGGSASASAGVGASSGSGGRGVATGGSSSGGSSAGGSSVGGGSSGGSSSAGSGAGAPSLPQPACDDGVAKGDACGPSSPSPCYKSCGPDNLGYKPLTCQGGMYDEPLQGCTFPAAQDYSCYRVPATLPAECPSGIPRGGRPCQIATCTVCFGGTTWSPQYQDSTGATKNGYCVCSDAGVWTCASNNGSWPCPDGAGCH